MSIGAATAGAAPAARTAEIVVHAGGVRNGIASTTPLPNGAIFQAVPTDGGPAITCTISGGTCTMTVPSRHAYEISELSPPSGYYLDSTLDVGGNSLTATPYNFQTPVLSTGDVEDVPGTTDDSIDFDADNHTFSNQLATSINNNTALAECGLNIALVLDTSGSMASKPSGSTQTKLQLLQNAVTGTGGVIDSLSGTPSKLAVYTFASTTGSHYGPASLTSPNSDLTDLTNGVNDLTAGGSTNWDQGLSQVPADTYDLVVVLTDGAPTIDHNGGSGNSTNFKYLENAIYSANALKVHATGVTGTQVVAIGIGVVNGDQNLAAISGPVAGTDYYPTSGTAFVAALKALAAGDCSSTLTVQKQVEDSNGQNPTPANGWTFSGSVGSAALAPTVTATSTNGTVGIAQWPVDIAAGATPTVTVTETPQPGYTLDRAACTVNGIAVTTTVTGNKASFAAAADEPLACTFFNKAEPTATLAVKKVDATTGALLAGATFDLHSGSATGPVVGHCTTSAAGTCSVSGLPYGDYVWVETAAPVGYELAGASAVITANTPNPVAVSISDAQKSTTLTLFKTGVSGTPLAGAAFDLHLGTPAGAVVGTCTTVASGACATPVSGLAFGTYVWVETAAPTGYHLSGPVSVVVDASNAGTTVTTSVTDALILSALSVNKTDAQTGAPLQGVLFDLHSETAAGTVIGSCATDAAGTCSVTNLPPGTYVWVERAAPAGYQLASPSAPITITLATAGTQFTPTSVVDNQKVTTLTVEKVDASSGAELAGVTFSLNSGSAGGASLDTCTTSAAGTCSVANVPFGTYYWVETAAPQGYQLAPPSDPVTVDATNAGTALATVTVRDEQILSTLTVNKTDAQTGAPMSGVLFDLHSGTAGGAITGNCTTDATGTCSVANVPFGTYFWVETAAPQGYQLAPPSGPITVDATNAGTAIATVTVRDEQILSTLTVQKIDAASGSAVNGATFELYQETVSGTQNPAADTSKGVCTTQAASTPADTCSIGGLPFGTYYWVETAAPANYVLPVGTAAQSTETVISPETAGTTFTTAVIADVAAAPGISLVKSAVVNGGTSYTAVGDVVTYSFAVTNTGNVPLTDVAVNETAFDGVGSLSAVSCPTTSLAANGGTETCTATYTVQQGDLDAGSITNAATATGTPPDQPAITSPPSSATVTNTQHPALTLKKTASVAKFTAVGATITYSFLVTNTGDVTIGAVAIHDPMFTGAKAARCPVATLAPGAAETCTATYVVTIADVAAGRIVNVATAGGTTPKHVPVISPPSTVTVTGAGIGGETIVAPPTPEPLADTGTPYLGDSLVIGVLALLLGLGLVIAGSTRRRRGN